MGSQAVSKSLPGTVAVSVVFVATAIVMAACAFRDSSSAAVSSLLAGLAGSLFVAGMASYVSAAVLAHEVQRAAGEPLRDAGLLNEVHGAGLRHIVCERADLLPLVAKSIDAEKTEIAIVGSSLKGLIGVGDSATGDAKSVREALERAIERRVTVNILMTHPSIAHHRSRQEGRQEGEIESEIIENLISLVALRERHRGKGPLNVRLYDGTPTIFMFVTSDVMVLNPYPYYSTAYGSPSFEVSAESEFYRKYHGSHYEHAWQGTSIVAVPDALSGAVQLITQLITGPNQHGAVVIAAEGRERLAQGLSRLPQA